MLHRNLGHDSIVNVSGKYDKIYSLSAVTFRNHLNFIQQSGLKTSEWKKRHLSPNNSAEVLITFDDGTECHYELARPILNEFKCKGHFFICTKRVNQGGYLTSDQIKEMCAEGHTIGSHTETHPALSSLTRVQLEREIRSSKEYLEDLLNEECKLFCPPGGDITERIASQVISAGYKAIFTSRPPIPLYQLVVAPELRRKMIGRWMVINSWTNEDFKRLLIQMPSTVLPVIMRYYSLAIVKKAMGIQRYSALRSWLIRHLKS
jgi:peptidoglycan/xylan/chitin deacetylase (PgdA/CDA1 family)